MFHENRLPADNSHEISFLICYFLKSGKIWKCHLLQIIGGALRVKPDWPISSDIDLSSQSRTCLYIRVRQTVRLDALSGLIWVEFANIYSRRHGGNHLYCKFRKFSWGYYFLKNSAYAKFRENKTLAKWYNHSAIFWYRSIMPLSRIFNVANMSFKAIRKNKILAKISEFTTYISLIRIWQIWCSDSDIQYLISAEWGLPFLFHSYYIGVSIWVISGCLLLA